MLWELGDLEPRVPDKEECRILKDLQALAKDAARRALADLECAPDKYSVVGVFATDELP
jgi:hypothetical protein